MALILTANPKTRDNIYIQFGTELVKLTIAKDDSSSRVKLLFDAPRSVTIDREKPFLSKQQNK
jgi:sRNA-binding carbon storage regulator CsrA